MNTADQAETDHIEIGNVRISTLWVIVIAIALFFAGAFAGMIGGPNGSVTFTPGSNPTGIYVFKCDVLREPGPPTLGTAVCPLGSCQTLTP